MADWTTGSVGMIGVSYNGTLPNQVATTGVEGLETIVPISAISSWYDYYRANGLVRRAALEVHRAPATTPSTARTPTCWRDYIGGPRMTTDVCRRQGVPVANQDRETGDWSWFWQQRDYLSRIRGVRSSVFVVHGLNDWNVMTKAFAEWWYRLADRRIPRKIWLHNGGHGGESQAQDPADWALYKRTENRWFDYWLFGVENGITAEPRLDDRARGRHVRSRGRLAGARHPPASAPAVGRQLDRARPSCPRAVTAASATSRSSTAAASSTPTTC